MKAGTETRRKRLVKGQRIREGELGLRARNQEEEYRVEEQPGVECMVSMQLRQAGRAGQWERGWRLHEDDFCPTWKKELETLSLGSLLDRPPIQNGQVRCPSKEEYRKQEPKSQGRR